MKGAEKEKKTKNGGHKQYTCSHLNSSSDSWKARTATIL